MEGLKCFFVICIVSLISVALSQDHEIPGKHFRDQIFSKTKQGDYNKCFQAKNFTDICCNFMLLCEAGMAFSSFSKRSTNSFLSQVKYFEPVTLKSELIRTSSIIVWSFERVHILSALINFEYFHQLFKELQVR